MLYLVTPALTILSVLLIYRFRFYTRKRLFGLYPAQAYILYFAAPIVLFCIFQIIALFEVPQTKQYNETTILLLMISIATLALGVILHSYSVTLSHTLKNKKFHKLWEKIHGPISHYLVYISTIHVIVFLGLLANDDALNLKIPFPLALLTGLCIGLGISIAVLRSLYIRINYLAATLGIIILSLTFHNQSQKNLPFFIFSFTTLAFILLVIGSFFLASRRYKTLHKKIAHLIHTRWTPDYNQNEIE